jgi:putative transposase
MVLDPADYRWSSHRCNACGVADSLLTPPPDYLALGSDADQRRLAYRKWALSANETNEIGLIREHTQRQHAYGTEGFRAKVEATLGRSAGPQKLGRPRKLAAA